MGGVTIDVVIQDNNGTASSRLGYNVVQAGSWMNGWIFIHVQGSSSISATALDLTFTGSEHAEIEYEEHEGSGDDRRTVRRTDSSSRTFFQEKIPVNDVSIFQQKATIAPGQYHIPFRLQLLSHLPGSMNKADHGSSCSIDYNLKAILKGSGFLWNFHHQVTVQVLAKPRGDPQQTPPSPQFATPVNEKVHACCCINRGSMSLGGHVDETRLYRGAECTVHMSCRNYSTAKPRRVQARLRQEIKWQASGGRSHSCVENVVAVDFPTILHSLQHEPRQQQRFPGDLSALLVQNEYQEMYHEITQGVHRGTFRVPPSVYNTYAGHLITVTHRLELEIQTGCCISDPSVYIPLYIGEPPNANAPQVATAEAEVSYLPMAASVDVIQAPAAIVPETNMLPIIHVPSSSVYPIASAMPASLTLQPQKEEEDNVYEAPAPEAPSFGLLMREMRGTVLHLDLIQRKLKEDDWAPVWQRLTPVEFGKIIGAVSMGFDQPHVAKALALKKDRGTFTCDFAVSAVRASLDYQRAAVAETLVPFCSDLRQNHGTLEAELTDWEKVVTQRAFANALAAANTTNH